MVWSWYGKSMVKVPGMVWYGMVLVTGMVWYGMVWYEVWYGSAIWYGMVIQYWYGMVW